MPLPPPRDTWDGLRAPSGVTCACALMGALVASHALVREIASGGVCALGEPRAAWDAATEAAQAGCAGLRRWAC